jgi:hypothetical protein
VKSWNSNQGSYPGRYIMKRRPYRKILLAIDGSENAKSAACSGIEIAKNTGAEAMPYTLPASPAVLLLCPRVTTGK